MCLYFFLFLVRKVGCNLDVIWWIFPHSMREGGLRYDIHLSFIPSPDCVYVMYVYVYIYLYTYIHDISYLTYARTCKSVKKKNLIAIMFK